VHFKLVVLLFLIFTGCGYKPTSYYAKKEISGDVFVKLNISIDNSIHSVLIKDAINEMVVNQFGASLTNNRQKANTIINVSLNGVSFKSLQDDNQGYASLYKTSVNIALTYLNTDTNIANSFTLSGSYDYSVDTDSLITDTKKQESIKIATQKALGEIFSKIAVQSLKKAKKDKSNTKKKEDYSDSEKPIKSKSYFFFK
jgi:hypothetical protein